MPAKPEPRVVLRNAFNKETFLFPAVHDNPETATFDVILGDGGSGGGNALMHRHPCADETFEVQSGCLKIVIGKTEHVLRAGQSATIPRGTPHHFRNGSEDAGEFTVTFSPAQRHRHFFKTFAKLTQDQPTWFAVKGDPNVLLIALRLHTYRDHLYLTGLPIRFQKIVFAVLAPVARLRGYRLELEPDA